MGGGKSKEKSKEKPKDQKSESSEPRRSLILDSLYKIIRSLRTRGLGRYSVSTMALTEYGTQTMHLGEYNTQTVKSRDDVNKIFYPRFYKHHSTQTIRCSQAQTVPESEIFAGKNKAVQVQETVRIPGPKREIETQTDEEDFIKPRFYSDERKDEEKPFISQDKRFIVRYSEEKVVIIAKEPKPDKPKGRPYMQPVTPTLSELQLKVDLYEEAEEEEMKKESNKSDKKKKGSRKKEKSHKKDRKKGKTKERKPNENGKVKEKITEKQIERKKKKKKPKKKDKSNGKVKEEITEKKRERKNEKNKNKGKPEKRKNVINEKGKDSSTKREHWWLEVFC